jgi:nucleotide-binding universal stress UspA family protein
LNLLNNKSGDEQARPVRQRAISQHEQFFKKILVPTDGSFPSLIAQGLAAFLAKKFKSKVTVLHVIAHEFIKPHSRGFPMKYRESDRMVPYQEPVPTGDEVSFPEAVAREPLNSYYQRGKRVVAEATAFFKEENIPVDQRLVEDADPAETILEEAERGNFDLIVMGHCGVEEKEKPHLGSIAEKVSRHAKIPVLIAHEKIRISKILVSVDGSENTKETLQYVIPIAKMAGAKITLLSVQKLGPLKLKPKVTKEMGFRILPYVTDLVEGIELEKRLESGDPANAIIQIAEKEDFDLIVMGSRGLGGVGRFLLGSVRDHVCHYTNRSVLLIQPPTTKTVPENEIDI